MVATATTSSAAATAPPRAKPVLSSGSSMGMRDSVALTASHATWANTVLKAIAAAKIGRAHV